jgi:hypothetical protein
MADIRPVLRVRNAVSAVAPDAPNYATAREILLHHLPSILP